MKQLLPGDTIGIVGGGQLGQMMTLSAKAMGFKVGILDPQANCSAGQVADFQVVAPYDDTHAFQAFSEQIDVLTYEFENVSVEALEAIAAEVPIPQGLPLLRISQNRIIEKGFLTDLELPVANYEVVSSPEQLIQAVQNVGYPCVLKTSAGGYDGKGQVVLHDASGLAEAQKLLLNTDCVLEAWVDFELEISAIITADGRGDFSIFPIAENWHRQNILHESIVPARIDKEVAQQAQTIATTIAEALHTAGTLCVELFVTRDGNLIVNEIAPRPHNSGHHSIESCSISQFDAHIRALAGWPLPSIDLLQPAVMVNILGQDMPAMPALISQKANWAWHFYGKDEAKFGRKMGHVTILTDDVEQTLRDVYMTKAWDN